MTHWVYEKGHDTGMEPWFEFWQAVRYAVEQIWIEYENRKAYLAEMREAG